MDPEVLEAMRAELDERFRRANRALAKKPPAPKPVRHDVPADRAFDLPRDQFPAKKIVTRYHGTCTKPALMPTKDVDVVLAVRCRTCQSCLRAKRYLWAMRAELETLEAPETVMLTLTFRDQHREREVAERELTLYLYRLRQNLSYRIRYLACFEKTEAGAWHIHALIHGPRNMHRNTLRKYWTAGYSWAAVADINAAGYVTKYVTKDIEEGDANRPRVRCSRDPRYGDAVMNHDKSLVQVLAASKHVNVRKAWDTNVRELFDRIAEKRNTTIWQQMNNRAEMHHLTEDGRSVNETTGEISQKVK